MRIQSTNNQNFTGTFQLTAQGRGKKIIKILQEHNPTGMLISYGRKDTNITVSYFGDSDIAVFSALSNLSPQKLVRRAYIDVHGLNNDKLKSLSIAVIDKTEPMQPRIVK